MNRHFGRKWRHDIIKIGGKETQRCKAEKTKNIIRPVHVSKLGKQIIFMSQSKPTEKLKMAFEYIHALTTNERRNEKGTTLCKCNMFTLSTPSKTTCVQRKWHHVVHLYWNMQFCNRKNELCKWQEPLSRKWEHVTAKIDGQENQECKEKTKNQKWPKNIVPHVLVI